MPLEGPKIDIPQFDPGDLFKVLAYIIIAVFVVYAIFLFRQVVLASKVLKTKATPVVRFLAFLHLIAMIVGGIIVVITLIG